MWDLYQIIPTGLVKTICSFVLTSFKISYLDSLSLNMLNSQSLVRILFVFIYTAFYKQAAHIDNTLCLNLFSNPKDFIIQPFDNLEKQLLHIFKKHFSTSLKISYLLAFFLLLSYYFIAREYNYWLRITLFRKLISFLFLKLSWYKHF